MTTPIKAEWTSPDGSVRLLLGDCLEILGTLSGIDCVVTDPPYGIGYSSGMTGHDGGTALPGIVGDENTELRDSVLRWWGEGPALVFGSWKVARPIGYKMVLIWEKGDHVGMGDLSIPWKPNTEEIYVFGRGFSGHRGSSVLRFSAPVTWNSTPFGRDHPHQKPDELMEELVGKCPHGTIVDPFCGSCPTGVACIRTSRRFIGIEIERRYWEIAVKRCKAELERFPLFEKPKSKQLELLP